MSNDVLSWEKFYDSSRKRNTYPPKEMDLYNRLVAHSENFFAISAIGPFTEGYLLIVTKKLLPSFALIAVCRVGIGLTLSSRVDGSTTPSTVPFVYLV